MLTDKEIVYFLDILLPSDLSDKTGRSKSANEMLSSDQVIALCDIARKLCSKSISKIKNQDKYISMVRNISTILKSIGYNQNMTRTYRKDESGNNILDSKGNPTVVTNGYTNMPLLIKQVIYFLTIRILQNRNFEFTQKDVWEEFRDNGIQLGHNSFSGIFGKLTPKKYWRCVNYHQPENPIKYMGQKRGRLGIAIKHLVGQAELQGKYENYVDVFGGSSSATVAPVFKKNVTYIYNDIDVLMSNYVEVVASDSLYIKLIDDIKIIQGIIKTGSDGTDLDDIIDDYINKRSNNKRNRKQVTQRMQSIQANGLQETEYDNNSIDNFLMEFQNKVMPLVAQGDLGASFDLNFGLGGKKYTKQEIQSYNKPYEFMLHYSVIRYLTEMYEPDLLDLIYDSNAKSMPTVEKDYQFYRAFGIFVLCRNMYDETANNRFKPKSTDEKITYAEVLLIMQYFRTSNEAGSISSITKDTAKWEKFCEENFDKLIEDYHKELRRVKLRNIRNVDCLNLINTYANENEDTLFYVDSPYVGTLAYRENDSWTTENMKNLIDALFHSGQKFIFSMRPCKDGKVNLSSKQEDKIAKINHDILEVLKYFKTYHNNLNKLYVLAVDFNMDILETCIKNHSKCEIMITNYRICSFYNIGDKLNSSGDINPISITSKFITEEAYKVLEFDQFYDIAGKALQ